jgi:nucleoside-diphosphate-sugar epimerase
MPFSRKYYVQLFEVSLLRLRPRRYKKHGKILSAETPKFQGLTEYIDKNIKSIQEYRQFKYLAIMPTVFITAASGHIGSKLIPLLLSEGNTKLVLPTTNAAKLTSALPKSDLITIVEGSIQDPQWVETQLKTYNVDTVFLCLTGTDELFTTLNIFSALQRTASMRHIVYLSACGDFKSSSAELGSWKAAHAVVKVLIETALRGLCSSEKFTHTILGPALFFDNDVRQKGAILKGGVYPEPLGKKGASRVSADDIADAVRIALLDQGRKWDGKKIMLGSRKKYAVSMRTIRHKGNVLM